MKNISFLGTAILVLVVIGCATTPKGESSPRETANVQNEAGTNRAVVRTIDPYAEEAFNRARSARSMGEALEAVVEAIRLDPDYEDAYIFRARLMERFYWDQYDAGIYDINTLELVIGDITHAIRINPNNAGHYLFRGEIYNSSAQYYGRLGDVNNRNRFHDLAIADYTQVIQLDQNNARAYYNRGDVYAFRAQEQGRGSTAAQSNWDHAIENFTQVIRLEPNNANAHFWRGFAYIEKRDRRGMTDLETALRIEPNHADARMVLDSLRAAGW